MPGDFESTLERATAGDANAQFAVAEAYRTGDGVSEDTKEALRWYRAAAMLDLASAQNDLGTMYLNGIGTESHPAEATYWYRKAAEQGEKVAQFNLAMRYIWGSGTDRNIAVAVHWLQKSASQGYAEATGELGTMYRFGRGVKQDFVTAAQFHTTAGLAGDEVSRGNLSGYRDEIERAALGGSALAALCLVRIHGGDLPAEMDPVRAVAWLRWAKLHGSRDNDPEVQEELNDWDGVWAPELSDADNARVNDLLAEMRCTARQLNIGQGEPAMTSPDARERATPESPSDITILDRFQGCLLGGAVGDALGAPVEFMTRAEILRRFGPEGITAYAPAYGGVGTITDDTQMTLFTAEGLLRAWVRGCLKGMSTYTGVTAHAYLRWLQTQDVQPNCDIDFGTDETGWLFQQRELHSRRAPGNTCLSALQAMKSLGQPARNDSKGCGGVMRVAPVGLFGWREMSPQGVFRLGTELAALTHGHPTGALTGGVFAVLIQMLIDGASLPDALVEARRYLRDEPRHEETLRAIESAEDLAASRLPRLEAIARLGQGWIAEEALAISIYCALVAQDFRDGIVLAVNHDGDSDSTGAITGNLLGSMLGVSAIPPLWLEDLELRPVIAEVAEDLLNYREWDIEGDSDNNELVEKIWKKYPGF